MRDSGQPALLKHLHGCRFSLSSYSFARDGHGRPSTTDCMNRRQPRREPQWGRSCIQEGIRPASGGAPAPSMPFSFPAFTGAHRPTGGKDGRTGASPPEGRPWTDWTAQDAIMRALPLLHQTHVLSASLFSSRYFPVQITQQRTRSLRETAMNKKRQRPSGRCLFGFAANG
jgi:hypothetical protein